MFAPPDTDIIGLTKIEITTTNADDLEDIGIIYPAVADDYILQIEVDNNGDAAIDESGAEFIKVVPNIALTLFEVFPGQTSGDTYNLIQF